MGCTESITCVLLVIRVGTTSPLRLVEVTYVKGMCGNVEARENDLKLAKTVNTPDDFTCNT